jgi:hypothetical protein
MYYNFSFYVFFIVKLINILIIKIKIIKKTLRLRIKK